MKKIMTMAIAAAMMAGVAATPALANQHDKDWNTKVEKMVDHHIGDVDTNKDGKVSRAEMQAYSNMHFNRADTNNDGVLTRKEIIAAHKTEHKKWKNSMHKDGTYKNCMHKSDYRGDHINWTNTTPRSKNNME